MNHKVDVLIFKGIRSSGDPYLRFGHIGIIHPLSGVIYGFGPVEKDINIRNLQKGQVFDATYSDHTSIFLKASSAGLSIKSFKVRCIDLNYLLQQIENPDSFHFKLPNKENGISLNGPMNCVGALYNLGVILPGRSCYIKEIIKGLSIL